MTIMKIKKVWVIAFIFMIMIISLPTVMAGEDASMDDSIKVSAIPSQQGRGGEISITITTTFYGGCCYALFANEVETELIDLPKGVEQISDMTPGKIKKFEATAGGGPVPLDFKCTITSLEAGTYVIKAKVTTSNCGVAEGSVTVTFTKGCVISIPSTYPKQPSTDRNTNVKISAYSPMSGVTIDQVTLYYVIEKSDTFKNLKPENEKVDWDGGNKEGKSVSFTPIEFEENSWKGEIPKQGSESFLAYWIVAEDNFGNKTTSPAYVIEVKDMEKIHLQNTILTWGLIIAIILGVSLIGVIWRYAGRIQFMQSVSGGIQLIGSKAIKMKDKDIEVSTFQKKRNLYRSLILLILVIITVALIYMAIQGDQYEILRREIGG